MITCKLMGGLGNQLFQIFATISLAIQYKQTFSFLETPNLGKRNAYWDTLLISLQRFLIRSYPKTIQVYKEHNFHYERIVILNLDQKMSILLDGYFQSYKYFENNFETICKLIRFSHYQNKIREKYKDLFDLQNEKIDTISIHFRLVDYKYLQHSHPVLPLSYYISSIAHILKNNVNNKSYNVLYFC